MQTEAKHYKAPELKRNLAQPNTPKLVSVAEPGVILMDWRGRQGPSQN